MKNQNFQKLLVVISAFTTSVFFAQNLWAQDTSAGTSKPNVVLAAGAGQTAPKLSYGVPQVLELAHAKISDNTIIAYIRNSGTVYRLDASQIVYLKRQGVSEAVIDAMINQRPRASATAMQNTKPPAGVNAGNDQPATVVAQPGTAYVQTVPSSTAYVVPDTQSYYYYTPYYYPYYGYYGWPFPAIFFSFGYGGGHWGGHHGDYHYGGGYRGGGFHGGGGHHH
jgi:uncharacterized membrane protein YgcG